MLESLNSEIQIFIYLPTIFGINYFRDKNNRALNSESVANAVRVRLQFLGLRYLPKRKVKPHDFWVGSFGR